MTRIIKAIYEGGMLRPLEPLDLPDRSEVEIAIPTPEQQAQDTSLYPRKLSFVGIGRSGRRDVSERAENLLRVGFAH
jgi:predicted DNA-binding antitoxin AbrB/MazE fold protein